MKRITLTYNEVRHGLDCCQCAFPFDAGDHAYMPIDGDWSSPVACSRGCMTAYVGALTKPYASKDEVFRVNRYLEIAKWLGKRYRDADGMIVQSIGLVPSRYKRLLDAFTTRYA